MPVLMPDPMPEYSVSNPLAEMTPKLLEAPQVKLGNACKTTWQYP
jgi:hypothetical protein